MIDRFEEAMFKNTGKTLCDVAYYLFWFDLLAGVLCLLVAFLHIIDESFYGFPLLFVSLSVLVSAFATALPIYGFGKLLQDVQAIKEVSKKE